MSPRYAPVGRYAPLAERLATKYVIDDDGCWVWIGALDKGGYGRFSVDGMSRLAHRISYQLHVGPIPGGLTLDHLCRNRACINPAHLEPVTHAENIYRGESSCVQRKHQTHCIHGHEFTPENTYVRREGWRMCRECKRIRDRRFKEKEPA